MKTIEQKILQANGQEPADLVLQGGKIFDLITGDFLEGDVAICGDTIVGTNSQYDGKEIVDGKEIFQLLNMSMFKHYYLFQ